MLILVLPTLGHIIQSIIIITVKASHTATANVTSSVQGKACSSVFMERKHSIYLQCMGENYRLLRTHNN